MALLDKEAPKITLFSQIAVTYVGIGVSLMALNGLVG